MWARKLDPKSNAAKGLVSNALDVNTLQIRLFAENLSTKPLDHAIRPAPGSLRDSRLETEMIQKSLSIPTLFRGHLGQKDSARRTRAKVESVAANDNFFGIGHLLESSQHRDLQIDLGKLSQRQPRKSMVACRSSNSAPRHRIDERLAAIECSDTPTQVAVFVEGNERASRLPERL